MRIFVTGYQGRVGSLLLEQGCFPLVCDVTKYDEVEKALHKASPDIVVHLASVSDVDYCEVHKEHALEVNFLGTKFVADATSKQKCGMVLLSSDHVFGGRKGPYKEVRFVRNFLGQYDSPVNFYGITKLAAEGIQQVYPHMKIVRTSYLFSRERLKMELSSSYPTFIHRSFMYIPHFINGLTQYLNRYWEMPSLIHISGNKTISWYDFMLDMSSLMDGQSHILPNAKYSNKDHAPRPKKGGLVVELSKKFGLPQYSYLDGLKEMTRGIE